MQQAVQPQPAIPYATRQATQYVQQQQPAQHVQQQPPGNDPFARLAWLETQHQALFRDNAWLFQDNLRLNNERTRLTQEQERLQRQTAEALAVRPSYQSQHLEEQNQTLLAENRQLVEDNNRIALQNRELCENFPDANPEEFKALIKKLEDRIAALKKEVDNNSVDFVTCGRCQLATGIRDTLCSGCFKPATDSLIGREGKGSTRIKYKGFDHYGDIESVYSVSDSDGEERRTDRSHYYEGHNTQRETRLEQDLFDWLQDWCLQNSDKIERQRVLERDSNQPTMRKVVEDLRDTEAEIRTTYEVLAGHKKRKRQLKRKFIALGDPTPVVTSDESMLKKKLFTFCHLMASPQQETDCSRFPKLEGDRLLTEREVVKIFHQMMTPMRLLHHEIVTKPQQEDKKFKPRKANPNQWKILQGPGTDSRGLSWKTQNPPDRIEDVWVSTIEDARIAATALQNLIWRWNEGYLG